MPGRFSGSGDRYGFNGKEKDKSISSITAYDYGFRIYNAGIGKFLSVDPLSKEYPYYTPYQFAGDKPIWAIDLDGLEELMSTKAFIDAASKLGVVGNKRVGELFERMAVAALTGRSVTTFSNKNLNFYSQAREDRNGEEGPTQVRPDMVGFTFDISDIGASKTDIRMAANQFFEAKITTTTFTRAYRKGQLEAMIDVLSEQAKNNKDKAAELVMVTTSDFSFGGDLLKYAYDKGVSLSGIVVGVDEQGLIYFSSLKQYQAGKNHSGVFEKIKEVAKGVFGSGNPFDGHSGFDMKDFIEGITIKEKGVNPKTDDVKKPVTGEKDPDPIEANDY